MNLHAIAGPIIAAVNPMILATLRASSGNTTLASGKRTPNYSADQLVPAQVQALTFRDIQQVEGLNLQGTRVAIYLYGKVSGLIRAQQDGGDIIIISAGANAGTYLVAMVLEQWPDWVKVACTLQNP